MIAYVSNTSEFVKCQEVEFKEIEGKKFVVKKIVDEHELEVKQSKHDTIVEFISERE